ncbi:MAG TPA: GNAT family N-acetyltransferase [Nocardioidaceae bacterium]|nr:GNAT family N-acetyltransferase [Nocardioidaceae bacterium]
MTELQIVPIHLDDVPALTDWATTAQAVFLAPRPTPESIESRRVRMAGHRLFAGRDGDRTVATFRSFDSDLTVPGAPEPLPVNAISSVTVLPTHRRRGLLSRWITEDLTRAAAHGDVASILIASEAPIYRRFGFGVATTACTWTIDAGRANFLPPRTGSIELVDREDFVKVAPPVYDVARQRFPGTIGRPLHRWQTAAQILLHGNEEDRLRQLAIHRGADGTPDGLLVYRVEDSYAERITAATLHVQDLWAANDEAYADLWRYCCEVDFVTRVVAEDRSPREALPLLLTDPRMARDGASSDFVWVRLHDVPGAFTARRYPVPGALTVRVTDHLGQTDGTYLIEADETGAGTCTRVADVQNPDLETDAAGLASLWLGSGDLAALASAGFVHIRDAATHARADALLGWPEPAWCGTWF